MMVGGVPLTNSFIPCFMSRLRVKKTVSHGINGIELMSDINFNAGRICLCRESSIERAYIEVE